MASIVEEIIKKDTLNFKDYPTRPIEEFDLRFLRTWLGGSSSSDKDDDGNATSTATLTDHILRTHHALRAADDVHVYSCMSSLSYLAPRARLHPVYDAVVQAAVAAGNTYQILDVGSCMGQETRALIVDGVHPASITTSDVHDAYWRAGKTIFMDDGSREHPPFSLAGVKEVWGDWTTPLTHKFVAELKGTFDAVLCKNVHHALSQEQCTFFHARLYRVLKSDGGILFGTAVGRVTARLWARNPENTANRYLHSAESLAESLRQAGFTDVTVTASEVKPDYPDAARDTNEKHPGYVELMKDRRYLSFVARKRG
jgi:hypothetical protein